jgi:hypothetical protein
MNASNSKPQYLTAATAAFTVMFLADIFVTVLTQTQLPSYNKNATLLRKPNV